MKFFGKSLKSISACLTFATLLASSTPILASGTSDQASKDMVSVTSFANPISVPITTYGHPIASIFVVRDATEADATTPLSPRSRQSDYAIYKNPSAPNSYIVADKNFEVYSISLNGDGYYWVYRISSKEYIFKVKVSDALCNMIYPKGDIPFAFMMGDGEGILSLQSCTGVPCRLSRDVRPGIIDLLEGVDTPNPRLRSYIKLRKCEDTEFFLVAMLAGTILK